MDLLFDDESEQLILEEALKDEKILKALGPLNENWFDDLNEQFVQDMFSDSFCEKTKVNASSLDDEEFQDCKLLKAVSEIESKSHSTSSVSSLPGTASARSKNDANVYYASCMENGGELLKTARSSKPEFVARNKNTSLIDHLKNAENGYKKDFKFLSVGLQATDTDGTSADACLENSSCVANGSPARSKPNFKSENNPNVLSRDYKTRLPSTVCFTTASNKPLPVSSESLNRAKSLLSEIDSSCQQLPSQIPPKKAQLAGFKTASNKAMSISAAAIQKANRVMATLDNDNTLNASSLAVSCADSNEESVAHIKDHLDFATNAMPENPNPIVRFQTAGNKPVKISAAAWKKGRSFMSTVDYLPKSDEKISYSSSESRPSVRSKQNKRLSLSESSFSSPMVKPPKAKRRNSCYKPPRRTPLNDIQTTFNANSSNSKSVKSFNFEQQTFSSKRQLGLKQDQESQIYLSDESLLKAMALFEET